MMLGTRTEEITIVREFQPVLQSGPNLNQNNRLTSRLLYNNNTYLGVTAPVYDAISLQFVLQWRMRNKSYINDGIGLHIPCNVQII